jgi:hypothetical protein
MAMAQAITGEGYEVWMPAKADKIPSAKEIRLLQSSDVLLINGPGAAYAMWLPMVTLDRKKIFETTRDSFELSDYIQVKEHQIVHSHSGEGEHSHAWMVPHCWLNPRLALLQSEAVRDKLCEIYPEDADAFRENYRLLEASLRQSVSQAAVCRELLETEKVNLLLSDPRLKHFVKAVASDAESFLWFTPEEISVAKQQLKERLDRDGEPRKVDGPHLLLWARAPGVRETELVGDMKWMELDLIEAPDAKRPFADRVEDNLELLARTMETVTEVDDGLK